MNVKRNVNNFCDKTHHVEKNQRGEYVNLNLSITRKESNSMEFAIFMLVYNHIPDLKSLVISSKYATKIVLINNGSVLEVAQGLEKIKNSIGNKCVVVNYQNNFGVSKAYNKAINMMNKNEAEYIILLDHDAIFEESYFNGLFSALMNFRDEDFGTPKLF